MKNTTDTTTYGIWEPLKASPTVLLTTFKRSGEGVSTPVGFQFAQGKLYFTTWSTTGKVKRLKRNSHVTLAPCTKMGKPLGPTLEGNARRLTEAEVASLSSHFPKTLWGKLWNAIYRLRGWESVLYEVMPLNTERK